MPDWRYCPRCGTPLEARLEFGQSRPTCPNCGWIHFADPKVAAAAVLVENGRVLLVRRINEPQRGRWTLPAGFVNSGEDPWKAAERECLEETGLIVQTTRLMDVVGGREHERGADFVVVYSARIISGELKPGDDADRAEWFDLQALPPLAFRATVEIMHLLTSNRTQIS